MSKERYMVEQEKTYVKVRWQKRDDPEKKDMPEETEEELEERVRIERIAELEMIKSSLVFDEDEMTVVYIYIFEPDTFQMLAKLGADILGGKATS